MLSDKDREFLFTCSGMDDPNFSRPAREKLIEEIDRIGASGRAQEHRGFLWRCAKKWFGEFDHGREVAEAARKVLLTEVERLGAKTTKTKRSSAEASVNRSAERRGPSAGGRTHAPARSRGAR